MVYQRVKHDDRCFNKRGGAAYQHKIRVIVGTKINPVAHGITLPTQIANKFSGCYMNISYAGSSIIMESGCKVSYVDKMNEIEKNKTDGKIWVIGSK